MTAAISVRRANADVRDVGSASEVGLNNGHAA